MATRAAMETTFEDVKRLVYHTAYRFHRRYGGDLQEHIMLAEELFVRAYNSHDPKKSAITTWVRRHVFGGLFDEMRFRAQRNARLKQVPIDLDRQHCKDAVCFDFNAYTANMSDDGRMVVLVTLTNGHEDNPRTYIRNLLSRLGWRRDRINAAFQEVTERLNGDQAKKVSTRGCAAN